MSYYTSQEDQNVEKKLQISIITKKARRGRANRRRPELSLFAQ